MNTLLIFISTCIVGVWSIQYKGIHFVGQPFSRIQLSDYRSTLSLEHLLTTGANTVSIPITFFQDFKNSSLSYVGIHPFILESGVNETPTDKDLAAFVREAKRLGLKVLIQFHVQVNQPYWPDSKEIGDYWAPYNAKIWFPRYRELIIQYIRALEGVSIDFVSLGHNFYTLSLFETHWRELVDSVRNETTAKITYSAGFGDEDRNTGFWEKMDYIGVFPRFTSNSEQELRNEVKEFDRTLAYMHKLWKKPVIVTRVAMCSRPQDRIAQDALFRIVYESIKDHDYVEGIFFGDWVSDILYGGPQDTTYSIQGKQSEETVRSLYGGQRREIDRPEGKVEYTLNCDCYRRENQME